jgi:hypothetical protein
MVAQAGRQAEHQQQAGQRLSQAEREAQAAQQAGQKNHWRMTSAQFQLGVEEEQKKSQVDQVDQVVWPCLAGQQLLDQAGQSPEVREEAEPDQEEQPMQRAVVLDWMSQVQEVLRPVAQAVSGPLLASVEQAGRRQHLAGAVAQSLLEEAEDPRSLEEVVPSQLSLA